MLAFFGGMYGTWIFSILIAIARFGDTCCYAGIWIAHPRMFPTLFSVTSMGIASFFSRGIVIFAPMVAEVPFPIPMIVFTSLTAASGFTALFLIEQEEGKQKEDGKDQLPLPDSLDHDDLEMKKEKKIK